MKMIILLLALVGLCYAEVLHLSEAEAQKVIDAAETNLLVEFYGKKLIPQIFTFGIANKL